MGKKPTLHRVAQLAQVSPATVSRVAAGNTAVDPAIRERVLRAVTIPTRLQIRQSVASLTEHKQAV